MGDTTVDIFLETLKQLTTNSKLLLTIGEKDQLQSLDIEIQYLRDFLKITKKKRNEHIEVMNLVIQIKDVVLEAENTVELFVGHAYSLRDQQLNSQDHLSRWENFFDWLSLRKLFQWDRVCELFVCVLLCNNQDHLSLDLQSVRKNTKTLTAKVKQIYEENMYDVNGIEVMPKPTFPRSSGGGSSGEVVVGFEKEMQILMEQLHNGGKGGQLEIISIIGAPGGGKTTLAKELYQAPLTSHSFESLAWVVISQDYSKTMRRDMLISILKSASKENYEDYAEIKDQDTLGEKLHKCLKGRKYLIVMDDIWSIEPWNDIQRSFPRECKGSKVLLTSRQPIVIPGSDGYIHRLGPLQERHSWELLQTKVFKKKQCPPELVDIGKQIARKCKGLPLAIVAIAGMLATEDETLDMWKEVAKDLSTTIVKYHEGCMEILELSYNHLPLHLKACFLYIGAHPEDFDIPLHELIWLWIAEGFIQQSDTGKSLEAIAKEYLNALIERSLVTVARKSKSHGGIKACRIHDLLRKLCFKKAKEDHFFVKIYKGDTFSPSTLNTHRRLFVGCRFFHKFPQRLHSRNLHSFLYFSFDSHSWNKQNLSLSFFAENFEVLRVLHLISITSLAEIRKGDLVHLRYLALVLPRGVLHDLPNSFHYLSNLETLNLDVPWEADVTISLPCDIVKMAKLRHLYTKTGIFRYHAPDDEEEGSMLNNLQTLHRICTCERCLHFLARAPNLRKLGLVEMYNEGNYDLMLLDLEFLQCLETLSVYPRYHVYARNQSSVLGYPGFLTHKTLSTGPKLPPTLRQLTLNCTYLKWEELSIILRSLPQLEVLKLLNHACSGGVWNTSELEEGFSQLKYLKFHNIDFRKWIASEDQFPVLEVVVIENCPRLDGIPIGFSNLHELREIRVVASNRSVQESAREIRENQRYTKGDDGCLNLVLEPPFEDL